MTEAGLILQKWYKERLPKVEECFPTTKMKCDHNIAEGGKSLPLEGFLGAFIIFFVGTLIALMVFLVETIL